MAAGAGVAGTGGGLTMVRRAVMRRTSMGVVTSVVRAAEEGREMMVRVVSMAMVSVPPPGWWVMGEGVISVRVVAMGRRVVRPPPWRTGQRVVPVGMVSMGAVAMRVIAPTATLVASSTATETDDAVKKALDVAEETVARGLGGFAVSDLNGGLRDLGEECLFQRDLVIEAGDQHEKILKVGQVIIQRDLDLFLGDEVVVGRLVVARLFGRGFGRHRIPCGIW